MFVIPTLSNGGAERVISVLSTAMSSKREVVILKYYDMPDEYPVGDNVKIINLSNGDKNTYEKIGYLCKLKRIRCIIKEEKPDFVIPFLFHVALAVEIAAVGLKTNILQSMRIDPASSPKAFWRRYIRDFLVYKSKCSFVQNEKQKQYFKKKSHHKIHVLYNPISETLFDAKQKNDMNPYIICSMGRMESQKNFPLLIDAFEKAFADENDVQLLLYGRGSRESQLQEYIDRKNMADRIKLMGRTNDVKAAYENANMFVLSSDFEGMPNALMEAMAAGVPCVSTDCPTGPSDLIENGENGLLVPVGDVEAMAVAMRKIFSGEIDSNELAINARQTIADKCLPKKIADRMIFVCEQSIN